MSVEKSPKNFEMSSSENSEFIGWPKAFHNWYNEGKGLGATHVIYCYMRTGEYQYFPRYVMPDENVRDVVRSVSLVEAWCGPINEARFVFTYSQPFETQWALTKNMAEPVFNFD